MYAMQNTKLSSRLVNKIDGLVRDFWWRFEKGNHGIHLKAWDKLCLPKSLGGLGFRKTKEMNQAFLAKWGWNILNGSQSLCCRVLTAKYLKGKDILSCSNGQWDLQKLRDTFDRETVSGILKGGHPSGIGTDRWIWTLESKGCFSSKSAYLVQAMDRAPHCEVAPKLWNKLWNSKTLERHKVLWWCILSSALPVRAEIGKRFHIVDTSCPLCGLGDESIEHLFLSCNVAFYLWRSSPWGICPVCDTGIRVWDWVKFIWDLNNRGIQADDVFLYASIVVDTIWRVHNEKVHNNCSPDIKKCIDNICTSYADCHSSLLPSPTPDLKEAWSPPPLDWIKLNCDVKVGFNSMCIAVVARNHVGRVIRVQTAREDFSEVLCGEAAACCLAVSVALELGSKFVIVENDSRVIINALNGMDSHWSLENYVSFCTKSSPSFISCNFSYVSRTCNFAAHNVARWAFAHQVFGNIPVASLPDNIFCNDHEV
ncbi:uncharacterized protein LOC115710550 [Cannabis sativa]|uniref:uncharacterized protein LOC115710550 n=1 Tax=Cannabis sativa TaxID=3483 RepID=UPI0029CA33E6|nr:uncharacterized protein LOC115710550 [Cannabis sativa]